MCAPGEVTADVLIVEDDVALCDALKDTLEISGYTVLTAGDGASALELLDNRNAHVVVSDVQMRPMNGLELLTRVKSAHPEIPVILMTAYATIQQAVDAMREGAADYLVKPFEAEVLISKVIQFLPQSAGIDDGMVVDWRRERNG